MASRPSGTPTPSYNHPPALHLATPAVSGGPHSPLRCGDSKVAVGEFFIANGKRRQIGIIVGSQVDQDMLGRRTRRKEGRVDLHCSLKDVSRGWRDSELIVRPAQSRLQFLFLLLPTSVLSLVSLIKRGAGVFDLFDLGFVFPIGFLKSSFGFCN